MESLVALGEEAASDAALESVEVMVEVAPVLCEEVESAVIADSVETSV